MKQWGVNYLDTYSPVGNWMSIRVILTLIILIEPRNKSMEFSLAYIQDKVKIEIFMEIPIGFGVEVPQPREWIISMNWKHTVLRKQS